MPDIWPWRSPFAQVNISRPYARKRRTAGVYIQVGRADTRKHPCQSVNVIQLVNMVGVRTVTTVWNNILAMLYASATYVLSMEALFSSFLGCLPNFRRFGFVSRTLVSRSCTAFRKSLVICVNGIIKTGVWWESDVLRDPKIQYLVDSGLSCVHVRIWKDHVSNVAI